MEHLRCNEENGFCVSNVREKNYSELVPVVGNLAAVNVGLVVTIFGLIPCQYKAQEHTFVLSIVRT